MIALPAGDAPDDLIRRFLVLGRAEQRGNLLTQDSPVLRVGAGTTAECEIKRVVHRRLLHLGQDRGRPVEWPGIEVRTAGGRTPDRETAILHMRRERILLRDVIMTGQPKLFEIVDALGSPGGLTRRLDRR